MTRILLREYAKVNGQLSLSFDFTTFPIANDLAQRRPEFRKPGLLSQ